MFIVYITIVHALNVFDYTNSDRQNDYFIHSFKNYLYQHHFTQFGHRHQTAKCQWKKISESALSPKTVERMARAEKFFHVMLSSYDS